MNYHDFDHLVAQARSIRRFKADIPVSAEVLRDLIDLTRFTPSSRNLQPLKYIPVNEPDAREGLFNCLSWAGALKDYSGPSETERPGGYIVILGDTSIRNSFKCDHGIVAQTIQLGARARGLGCCIIASVNRDRFRELFDLDEQYEILLVLALGVPAEEVRIESLPDDGNIDYWRDDEGIHHVPKRSLEEVIVKEFTD